MTDGIYIMFSQSEFYLGEIKMKTTKRFAALFIAVLLVCSMIPFTYAAGVGTITVNDANKDQVYNIYKILDLESYNLDTGAYSYKISPGWRSFLSYPSVENYLVENSLGYVDWQGEYSDARGADFAKLAFSYVKGLRDGTIPGTPIVPDDTKLAAGTPLVFSDLPLGYYLVESTVGAVCSLSTTNPHATVKDKNELPQIEKYVQEDSTMEWGDKNTAQIGQRVDYETIITANAGATSYIVHDTMEEGLTFGETVTVKLKRFGTNNETEILAAPDTYSWSTATDDGCTFHVVFYEPFLRNLVDYDQIIIRYSATLNEKAKVHGDSPKDTNDNIVYLEYGNGGKTEKKTTQTKTFKFDLVKTDEAGAELEGATFQLYHWNGTEKELLPLAWVKDGVYRPALAGDFPTVIEVGHATIIGLDGDDREKYYLEEISAPDGFNMLTDQIELKIDAEGNVSVLSDASYVKQAGSIIQVENHKGAELPSTGGFGTKMFYLCGGLLTVVAFTHLVTRKRMKNRA